MALKKDFVLRIARALLLEPLVYCYNTEAAEDERPQDEDLYYLDAALYLMFCRECWSNFVRDRKFPESVDEAIARVEAYAMDTPIGRPVPGEEPITMQEGWESFCKSWNINTGREAIQQLSFFMTRDYLHVCDMQADFSGQPWVPGETTREDAAALEQLFREVHEVHEYIMSSHNVPRYITVLYQAGLLKQRGNELRYEADGTNYNGRCRLWGEAAEDVLQANDIKISKAQLFKDGYIVNNQGKPYATGSCYGVLRKKI